MEIQAASVAPYLSQAIYNAGRYLRGGYVAAEKMFSPREASKVLGISYATLKLWIYKGKVRTIKTAGGHHRIPESQLDKFLHSASDRGEVATKGTGFRNISGR